MSFFRKYYPVLKWAILVLAYGFLFYKLSTFDNYYDFINQMKSPDCLQLLWLLLTLVLLPLNWLLEAVKWRELISDLEQISLAKSLQTIFSGITTGFFTPNRIGEYPGRALFLNSGSRVPAIALGFVGSLAQTLAILVCGVPAAILFFIVSSNASQLSGNALWVFFFGAGLLLVSLYCCLPVVSSHCLRYPIKNEKIRNTLQALEAMSAKKLLKVFLLSLIRYTVFCLQLFLVLRFFGIRLSVAEAVIGIATNYLFVTFTPSIALSEAAIRGSYAIIFIGAFTDNVLAVAAAGITLWLINYCLPMIIGSFVFSKSKL